MAIIITGSLTVQDGNGQQHTIPANWIPFEEVSSEQRSMGPCRTHEGIWEEDDWSVTISAEEFPANSPNGHEVSVRNCTLVKDNIRCENGD